MFRASPAVGRYRTTKTESAILLSANRCRRWALGFARHERLFRQRPVHGEDRPLVAGWYTSIMGFFDSRAADASDLDVTRLGVSGPWRPPEDVLPCTVPLQLLLAHTSEVAIAAVNFAVYPTGFDIELIVASRGDDLSELSSSTQLWRHRYSAATAPADEFLRLGIQLADGGIATNLDQFPSTDGASQYVGPVLLPNGGQGTMHRQSLHYWVWPLPPAGPITFVCEWPKYAVEETRCSTDATPLLIAAEKAFPLWRSSSRAL